LLAVRADFDSIMPTQPGVVSLFEPIASTLRFSCPLAGGRQLLMPLVFEYLRRYNEMKVEVVTEGRLIDIIKEGFDAGGASG
jgi:DNA-binding transcriptional LysR family regulator